MKLFRHFNKKEFRRVLLTILLLVFIVLFFYLITSSITKFTGLFVSEEILDKEKHFINCLTEKEIILFINSADENETISKIEINKYVKYFKIVNCHYNNKLCIENDISDFPVLMMKDVKLEGELNLKKLSRFSDCRYESA